MTKRLYPICIVLSCLLLCMGIAPVQSFAAGGFSASLATPSRVVSQYDQPVPEFSAALYPTTQYTLANRSNASSRQNSANGTEGYLRFQDTYYTSGNKNWSLIPNAANAGDFNTYRNLRYDRSQFGNEVGSLLIAQSRGNSRQGLGVNIQLPGTIDKIVGEGGAGLKVVGQYRIDMGGRSNWNDASVSDFNRPSRFPSLEMQQRYRFDITGTIGSKISVKVSEDNQTDIPLANRIQIRYKGDDDDILKTIEAGNTTLNLKNTRFSGYSQSVQGLFGLKAEAQLGPVRMTGIISQEKGSAERSIVTPGGEENADIIRDWNYEEGRIFDLGLQGEFAPGDSVINVEVYQERPIGESIIENYARLYVKPEDTTFRKAENFATDSVAVVRIEKDRYVWQNDHTKSTPYLVFMSSGIQQMLGVWMVVWRQATHSIDTIGDISGDTTALKLKLLRPKPERASPSDTTWTLMWRNCYRIPRGALIDDIKLKIFFGLPGNEGSGTDLDYQEASVPNNRYIMITGLDQVNTANAKSPDGLLDNTVDIFRPDWGLLIFPQRRPFSPDSSGILGKALTYAQDTIRFKTDGGIEAPRINVQVPEIYDSKTERQSASQYYLQLTSKTRGANISLQRPNIIEGSERVTLNGRTLVRDADYTINYDIGQVTLISQEALDPNANVQVEFEYAPFFSLQKKSLYGARAEYSLGSLELGSTFLYKTDKAQDRKPRVGQETAQMLVLDADAKWDVNTPFLTKAANALPLVSTVQQSRMSVVGEVAQSRPNPNVDNVGYVDDFETATEELTLGNARQRWHFSSRPPVLATGIQRAKLLWHSPDPTYEALPRHEDIYNTQAQPNESVIRTFRMIFRPNSKDTLYDTTVATNNDTTIHIQSIVDANRGPSWAGITRLFYGVDAKRAQLFEMRAKVSPNSRMKMHFDFGIISEDLDLYPSTISKTFSEDTDNNGKVNTEEDVGLDGLANLLEDPRKTRGGIKDPDGDNWYYAGEGDCPLGNQGLCDVDSLRYDWLNGTEGNLRDNNADPDKEALGSTLEDNNAYFSYVIDFNDPTSPFFSDSLKVPNSEKNGWVTYRIPIRDPKFLDTSVVSDANLEPDWNKVTHVRVWFESTLGETSPDTVEVADWQFVQSNWQDTILYAIPVARTSNFTVATISEEDGSFTPPPGVEAYKDPTTNVKEPQRGLQLKFENLQTDDTCIASKDLLTIERYGGYQKMEMYVNAVLKNEDDHKVRFFFRLGQDVKNYYEFNHLLDVGPRWDPRNFVTIDFNQMTALKDSVLRTAKATDTIDVSDTVRGYRIVGRPNINQIRYFASGVVNTDTLTTVSGEVWLDELRVTNVRKDVGTAGRVNLSGSVADLLTYGGSYEYQDAYFRQVSTATRGGSADNLGSGSTRKNWGYNLGLSLHKFLPVSWGASIPINYSYNSSTQLPILRTNSDIVLAPDVRESERSTSTSESFSLSERFDKKGNNPLFTVLLNRLNTNFSYRRSRDRSVTNPEHFGENISMSGQYDLGMRKVPSLSIFPWLKSVPIAKKTSKTKLYFYPTQWTINADYSRTINISRDADSNLTSSLSRQLNGRMSIGYKVFDRLTTNWDWATTRDLSDLDLVKFSFDPKKMKLGRETNFSQSAGGAYDPDLLKFFSTRFSYKASYSDYYELSDNSRRATLSTVAGIDGSFDHQKLFTGKGGSSDRQQPRTQRGGRRTNPPPNAKDTVKEPDQNVKKKEKENSGTPFYMLPVHALKYVTSWFDPIGYKYSKQYNDARYGLKARPEFAYQLGLTHDIKDSTILGRARQPQQSGQTEAYESSTKFRILGGIQTSIGFSRSISKDLVKQGTKQKNTSTFFPRLTITIAQFHGLPIFQKEVNTFIRVFSPQTSYSKSQTVNEDITTSTPRKIGVTTSQEYRPLLAITFNIRRDLSMSGSYSLKKETIERFNPTTGKPQSSTNTKTTSITASSKYSFSAPGGIAIPLFGKLKFRSTMNLGFDFTYNRSLTDGSNQGATTDKDDWIYKLTIAYNFSTQVSGGLEGYWQDSNDGVKDQDTHTRSLNIFAQMNF